MLRRFLEFLRKTKVEKKEKQKAGTRGHAIEKLRNLHKIMKS